MKSVDYLIVGGSAAGTSAAETIRSLKSDATITIITEENHEQYSRVLLPYYIRGEIPREKVFLKNSDWYLQKKIELAKSALAIKLEADKSRVTTSGGEVYEYGKLLIAVGGFPVRLNLPGADLENILYLRTIEDADKIIKVASRSQRAVIVGGGFISLDLATGFRANGVREVMILIREPYYWSNKWDKDSSQILQNVLEENGAKILTNEEMGRFEPQDSVQKGESFTDKGFSLTNVGAIVTKSGKRFECDVVGVGIGIKSDFGWLDGSGIKINRAIVTNEYMETSLPNIYAAGDCAEFYDVIFDRQHVMGNWENATAQGKVVSKTMCGVRTVFETASSYSDQFFGNSYSFTGVTDDKFADQIIVRGSVENYKMTRIFIKTIGGVMRIVGATVINNSAEVLPLTTAIKNKINVSSYKNKLTDLSFDLKNLVV